MRLKGHLHTTTQVVAPYPSKIAPKKVLVCKPPFMHPAVTSLRQKTKLRLLSINSWPLWRSWCWNHIQCCLSKGSLGPSASSSASATTAGAFSCLTGRSLVFCTSWCLPYFLCLYIVVTKWLVASSCSSTATSSLYLIEMFTLNKSFFETGHLTSKTTNRFSIAQNDERR